MNGEKPSLSGICGALRCKEYYVFGEAEFLGRCDDTTVYWCGHTMRPVGPDETLALPETCRRGRPCYEAEVV
jgi:hypothetical protein